MNSRFSPRYKISQKWTHFPSEFNQQIRSLFEQNFKEHIENKLEVTVEGRIYSKEITLRLGLHRKGELKHFNFEASVDLDSSDEKTVFAQISLAIDAIATLVAEYFENDQEIELPYTWTETSFDQKKVWIQHSSENPNLEAEADKLLGITDDSLLKNADEEKSEDALDLTEDEFSQFAESLEEEKHSQEDDDLKHGLEPQMLKKKKKEDLH